MIIGFIASSFDLLHAGHVLMLAEARSQCDYLIVGLHTNPTIDRPSKNKPIQSTFERQVQLKGCKFVDEIIPYDTEEDLYNLLTTHKIDIRFLGTDYSDKASFTGSNLNIPIKYIERNHSYSSSELRKRINKNVNVS